MTYDEFCASRANEVIVTGADLDALLASVPREFRELYVGAPALRIVRTERGRDWFRLEADDPRLQSPDPLSDTERTK